MTDERRLTPWYREPWPWLLMIAPASALVGGFFTWWLAATTNNSLVVDDYYREGRAINQQLARDHRAAQLELDATLDGSRGIALVLQGRLGNDWPETLSLRLVHATESTLDSALLLRHEGGGRYSGPGALPSSGRWIVHLEDSQREWRLMARAEQFGQPLALRADPVAAGGGQ